eukprot:752161-Hanusia_phi.AAC.2
MRGSSCSDPSNAQPCHELSSPIELRGVRVPSDQSVPEDSREAVLVLDAARYVRPRLATLAHALPSGIEVLRRAEGFHRPDRRGQHHHPANSSVGHELRLEVDVELLVKEPHQSEQETEQTRNIRDKSRKMYPINHLEAANDPVMVLTTSLSFPRNKLLIWKLVICNPFPPNPIQARPGNHIIDSGSAYASMKDPAQTMNAELILANFVPHKSIATPANSAPTAFAAPAILKTRASLLLMARQG